MKKKLIVSVLSIVLCLTMILALAACNNEEATIDSIEATGSVTQKGDGTYDYSALTLKVVYSDGTKKDLKDVIADYQVKYEDGKFSVTVGGKTLTFTADINVTAIASVSATGIVMKKTDGTYDFSAIALTAKYADDYEKALTVADLTVTYNEETEKFSVTIGETAYEFTAEIVDAALVSVAVTGKVEKDLNGKLSFAGLTYTGTFEDQSEKALSVAAANVAYNEQTKELTVTVAEKEYKVTVEMETLVLETVKLDGYVDLHADGTYTFANLEVTAVCTNEKEIALKSDEYTAAVKNEKLTVTAYEKDIEFAKNEYTVVAARSAAAQDSLVIGYSNFSSKFSPFFYQTAYDGDVAGMTQVGLLASDRGGAPVLNGIEGETIAYNGTNYTYYGLSDVEIDQKDNGTVDYNITLRTGVKFSDGVELTLNDVLFNIYVLCDPSYDGMSTFYSLPIEGMAQYRTGLTTEIYNKYKAIADEILKDLKADGYNEENTKYTKDQYDALAAAAEKDGWTVLAKDIVNYCMDNYSKSYGSYLAMVKQNDVAFGMFMWGFGDFDDNGKFNGEWTLVDDDVPTIADYVDALKEAYPDFKAAAGKEAASGDYDSYLDTVAESWIMEAGKADMNGKTIDTISGVKVTGENTLTITTTEFSATTIYQLGISITPMHYYGNTAKFDLANNKFGFDKGDLSTVKAKTTAPMGAGPYKFVSYEQGIVTFAANEYYWEGAPKIENLMFKEYNADADKTPALIAGDIDIATPSINNSVLGAIKKANTNGGLKGNVIETALIDNNGYGYVGINSNRVLVGTDKATDASKNLRKAFATLFAVYRESAVNGYYGDRASVINYPISNCSWAAPLPNDEGYAVAYSKDVNGDAIYDADMSDEVKATKALEAAIGFLKAAGYTWDDTTKKFTAAPAGAKMSYEAWIPGDGTGDHPAMNVLTGTQAALNTIGIELKIKDLTNSSALWTALDAGEVDIWAAAWGGSTDPDMYQVYHSSNATGSNHYHIADETLDELIVAARKSADTSYRKAAYKECLDIILDWAVEIPTYQRKECTIFSAERIDLDTLTPDMTPFWSYLAEIYKLERTE